VKKDFVSSAFAATGSAAVPLHRERWPALADQGLTISLMLFLFALPLAYITAVREILLGSAAFFWLAAMVIRRRILIPRTPLDLPLLCLVAVSFLSLIWAVNPAYSFKEIKGELLKGCLVFYLAAYSAGRPERLPPTWLILVCGNLLLVVYALWDFWQAGGNLAGYYIRAGSLHAGYGELGTYLITVFPFLLILPLARQFQSKKNLGGLLALLALNLLVIYITFGRAMWLAAAAEFLLIGWMLNRKKILLGAMAGLLLFMVFIPKTVCLHGERLAVSTPGTNTAIGGTAGDLLDIWKLAFLHIQERPFQGIGFGRSSFSDAFPEFRAQHQPLLWHAHNTLLNFTFQTGIQGLVALLWVMGVALFHCFRRGGPGIDPWARNFSLAAGVMVVGFLIRNFFDDFFVDDNALMFWFLIGTALGSSRIQSGKTFSPRTGGHEGPIPD
jgi:O-antigen ligase